MDAVLLDRAPQRGAFAEDVRLADEVVEGRRPQSLRERRDPVRVLVGCVGEEVTHHRSMLRRVPESLADTWGGGSYERIGESYAAIHDRVVEALEIGPGARAVDVACGTGGVALRAARAGADVVGIDISAGQLAKARSAAADEGLAIRFDEGDCRELPYEDGEFDAVASAFGAIFAPDHRRAAAELARVCRPGGRLALTAWPRDEWLEVGERAGRPSPSGPDATDWAREDHLRALLGEGFELELRTGDWRIERDSADELWELVSTAMIPLQVWLAEQSPDVRARAEQVYRDYLAAGVLARTYVFVVGTRR